MKARILSAAAAWLLIVTALHVHLNVGWGRALDQVRQTLLGQPRSELVVGFLPVT